MPIIQKYNTVKTRLFQPLSGMEQKCSSHQQCKSITDADWLKIGVSRTLSNEKTGRGFLHFISDVTSKEISRSTFFDNLKSKRRLSFITEANKNLTNIVDEKRKSQDPLAQYSELEEFDIYAGDGHYHESATHDKKKDGKKWAHQHFYALNLRNHALSHITSAQTPGNKKKEHDMHALKRLTPEQLRLGATKGRKALLVWDRAIINFDQWYKWKQGSGIYIITREKKNCKLIISGHYRFDKEDPINRGVVSDEMVSGSYGGHVFRRVIFKSPETGEAFSFLTSIINPKISPGLIAFLYKTRWDVEKVFDEIKNKWFEQKAWASSDTAKTAQALFVCLTHNLSLLLEDQLRDSEDIFDYDEIKRRKKRVDALVEKSTDPNAVPSTWVGLSRLSQRGVRFIRWLRNNLFIETPWRIAVEGLRTRYALK